MDTNNIQETRKRLTAIGEELVGSINRHKHAVEQITLENTEDEADLAVISHNREVLYRLHESDFQQLKSIRNALKALDRGQYGDCVRCGKSINEKRLVAVPWATLCIQCQEEAEKEHTSSVQVMAGNLEDLGLQ